MHTRLRPVVLFVSVVALAASGRAQGWGVYSLDLGVARQTYAETPTASVEDDLSAVVAELNGRGYWPLVGITSRDQRSGRSVGVMAGTGVGLGTVQGVDESSGLFLLGVEGGLQAAYVRFRPELVSLGTVGVSIQADLHDFLVPLGYATAFLRGEGRSGPVRVWGAVGTGGYRELAAAVQKGRRYVGVRYVRYEHVYGIGAAEAFRSENRRLGIVAGLSL